MIPRDRLISGHYYAGLGRNQNVGLWQGQEFITISWKFNQWVTKYEGYWEEHSGCFRPNKDITDIINKCVIKEREVLGYEKKESKIKS